MPLLDLLGAAILLVHTLAMVGILAYGLVQLDLIGWYLFKGRKSKVFVWSDTLFEPIVTIQIPIYNEYFVAERIIAAVAAMEYPKHKLEIQVLDDSTDETQTIVCNQVEKLRQLGIDICHVRRDNRAGYKAGALKQGLETSKGEFVAVFDADFVPESDFLRKTLPFFRNRNVGVVQTRWEHLNRSFSLLTQIQGFGLDAHFTVEQGGRNAAGCFINFNGTAGIWRKACILDAGNWQADTLTEDLDLSYRAQLNGWEFVFLENPTSPSELPPIMDAVRSQQYRWVKGGAEVASKLLRRVWVAKIPNRTKIHGMMHLLNSAVFTCILTAALLSLPLLYLKQDSLLLESLMEFSSIFSIGFFIVALMYLIASIRCTTSTWRGLLRYFCLFPVFLAVSMGLSLHNAFAVMEGYWGHKTPFVRTPKFNFGKKAASDATRRYLPVRMSTFVPFEGLLSLIFAYALGYGLHIGDTGFAVFHGLLAFGFGFVFLYSIVHFIQSKRIAL